MPTPSTPTSSSASRSTSRDYTDAAAVLAELGVRTVRLLTNNPRKVAGLSAPARSSPSVVPLPTSPHHRNLGYLATKAHRLGHVRPTGSVLTEDGDSSGADVDVMALLGDVRPRADRPYIALKYAQTLDGRIATSTGDARWISGEPERRISHALRAACDAVMVGIGTVLQDDPELTVRMVPGASPLRVVLDSRLRITSSSKVLGGDAATLVITTERSDPAERAELRRRGVRVDVVPDVAGRISMPAALGALRSARIESVLVEGGAEVITSLLAAKLVDRLIVAVSPILIGAGTEAVGGLDIERVVDGIRLENRMIVPVGDDVVLAWDVADST